MMPAYAKALLGVYAKKMRDVIHEVQANETDEQAYEDIRKKIKQYKTDSAYEHIACMYTVFAVEDMIDRIEAAHQREVAELRECLKETMADAVAEYKNNSCFRNVKCGEIERCGTCKVMKWRKALEGASND